MTAQVIHSTMSLHPFPTAALSSPLATPPLEKEFSSLQPPSTPSIATAYIKASSSTPSSPPPAIPSTARQSAKASTFDDSPRIMQASVASSQSDSSQAEIDRLPTSQNAAQVTSAAQAPSSSMAPPLSSKPLSRAASDKGKSKDQETKTSSINRAPSNPKRYTRPRLHSLQSLNNIGLPASPSLSEQDSGRATLIVPSSLAPLDGGDTGDGGGSRSYYSHRSRPSLGSLRGLVSSSSALESLQPLAESARGAGGLKRHHSTREARPSFSRSNDSSFTRTAAATSGVPDMPSSATLPRGTSDSINVHDFANVNALSPFEPSSASPRRPTYVSVSPKTDETALSEFGQMGAPFQKTQAGVGGNDISSRFRSPFRSGTGMSGFLRRSHTISAALHSPSDAAESSKAKATAAEGAAPFRTPSPASKSMVPGASNVRDPMPLTGGSIHGGCNKDGPILVQRRQTISNVSPSWSSPDDHLRYVDNASDRVPTRAGPSRTLSYASHHQHGYHQYETRGDSSAAVATSSGSRTGSRISTRPTTQPSHHVRESGTLINHQIEAKVVILGSQGVGKTSLLHRYTSGSFQPPSLSLGTTIGANFLAKKLMVDGVKVRLQLWDTAGQERFRSMAPMYYRGSHAAIIVYDITSMASFMDVRSWIEELKRQMPDDLIIHVVGAKLDLSNDGQRQVDLDFARSTVRSWIQPLLSPNVDASFSSPMRAGRSLTGRSSASNTAAAGQGMGGASPGSPSRAARLSTMGGYFTLTSAFQRGSGSTGRGDSAAAPSFARASKNAYSQHSGASASSGGEESYKSNSDNGKDPATPRLGMPPRISAGFEPDLDTTLPSMACTDFDLLNEQIVVSEVSAKDDRGIDELFLSITKKLVQRGAEIERERIHRERNSIFLSSSSSTLGDDDDDATNDRLSGSRSRFRRTQQHPDDTVINLNQWSCCA